MAKTINKICILVIFIGLLLMASQSFSQPQRVTWDDLKEIKNSKKVKVPKKSKKSLDGGMFDTSLKSRISVAVYSPKGQAALYAQTAKENYIKLDSSTFYPKLFNQIKVRVFNERVELGMAERGDLTSIERVIILFGDDEVIEPDSIKFDKADLQNSYGAGYKNIDATCYFPLNYFDGYSDIKFIIFYNEGKFERKFKHKEVMKME